MATKKSSKDKFSAAAAAFVSTAKDTSVTASAQNVEDISINLIDEDPENGYLYGYEDVEALERSIKEIGFQSIIRVCKKGDGKYLCISGHSRLKAARNVGMKEIPCQVVDLPDTDDQRLLSVINLNTQRIKRPLYTSRQIEKLEEIYRNQGKTGDELTKALCEAFSLGKTQMYNIKSLVKLPECMQKFCLIDGFPYSDLRTDCKDMTDDQIEEFARRLGSMLTASTNEEGAMNMPAAKEITAIADAIKSGKMDASKSVVEKENRKVTTKSLIKKLDRINFDPDNIKIPKKDRAYTKEVAQRYIDYLNKIIEVCDK